MSDVESSRSDDADDDEYNTCDEDDDAYRTCDEDDEECRVDEAADTSSDEGRDWSYFYHTSDEDEDEDVMSPASLAAPHNEYGRREEEKEEEEGKEELDVLGAAPVIAVRKRTCRLQTGSVSGLGQCVQEMLQSCDLPDNQLVPTSRSQQAEDSLAIESGSALAGVSQTTLNVQLNLTQQQFGDVTVEKASQINQSFGGSQNISRMATICEGQTGREPSKADRIMRRTISYFQNWNKGMVRTAALDRTLDRIKGGIIWITIKGNPGEGKTTIGFMALEELHKGGRNVYEVRSPEEFTDVLSNSVCPVILLDDVFGNLEFDKAKWSNWEPAVSPLLKTQEHKSHEDENKTSKKEMTVILIGRDYVLNSASVDLGRVSDFITSDKHVINMDHNMKRDVDEKRAIWESISRSSGVKLDKLIVDEILRIEVAHGFPHVCHLFTTIQKKQEIETIDAVEFFYKPLEFLNSSILHLFKDKEKVRLFKKLLEGDGKVSRKELGKVDETCTLIQIAQGLTGSYLKFVDDFFVFDHPSVNDSMSFHMCSLNPGFVIKQCKLSFIHERLRLQLKEDSKSASVSSLVVYVDRSYADDLAERFSAEIKESRFFHVLSHQAFTDKTFVGEVMSRLEIPLKALIHWTDKDTGDTFLSLVASSKSPELIKFIDTETKLTKEDETHVLYGTCKYAASQVLQYLERTRESININVRFTQDCYKTPLMIAAETRDIKFIHHILSHNPDPNRQDRSNRTALHILSTNGLVSAIKMLLDIGANTNKECLLGETPLIYACRSNQTTVVEFLIERGVRVDGESLHAACLGGNIRIVNLLIARGVRVDEKSLHAACKRGNIDIVNMLIEKGVRVDDKTLEAACLTGKIDIVNMLIERGVRVDEKSLHAACLGGNIDIVNLLMERGVRIDEKSLHAACGGGNIDIVSLLMERGVKVDQKSLHAACLRGNIDIVNLLIERGVRVGQKSLHAACWRGNIGIVNLLIEREVRVDEKSLEAACLRGNIDIVNLLIARGLRVEEKSLHAACGGGNNDIVNLLMERGVRVDGKSLHAACEGGNIDCVKLLIERGVRVDQKSLHAACLTGNSDIVNLLIERGVRVDEKSLHAACLEGNIDIVKLLIKRGVRIDEKSLHAACGGGNIDIVSLLMERGVKVDEKSLHAACERGNIDCVKLLIERGVRVDQKSLHAACLTGNIDIVNLLIERGVRVDEKSLHAACLEGNIDIVNLLIERGVRIDEKSLHAACGGGNIDIVSLLMERGVTVDQKSLHAACERGNIDCVNLLIERGVTVDQKSLHAACLTGNIDIVNLLIEREVRVDEKSLETACLIGNIDIVNMLIERGVRVDEKSLHVACRRGNIDIVNLLIERRVRVDEKSLHAACEGGNINIVNLLIDRGVRVDKKSLNAACEGGNLDIVNLLKERGVRVDEKITLCSIL